MHIKNNTNNPFNIAGMIVPAGEQVEITEKQYVGSLKVMVKSGALELVGGSSKETKTEVKADVDTSDQSEDEDQTDEEESDEETRLPRKSRRKSARSRK